MADWEHVLDVLVRERGAALVRCAVLLTGGTAEAADLAQEALVRAFSQGRPLREARAAEASVRRAVLGADGSTPAHPDGHARPPGRRASPTAAGWRPPDGRCRVLGRLRPRAPRRPSRGS